LLNRGLLGRRLVHCWENNFDFGTFCWITRSRNFNRKFF
jgi:hypothetical protein